MNLNDNSIAKITRERMKLSLFFSKRYEVVIVNKPNMTRIWSTEFKTIIPYDAWSIYWMIKIEIPDTIKKTLINLRYEIVSFLMFTPPPFYFLQLIGQSIQQLLYH